MDAEKVGMLITMLLTMWQEWRHQKAKREAKKADKVTDILPSKKRGKK